ncbi:transglycosylase domain-containing protein [Amycolatopsis sp. A133]|uniref:transglycosylase domain-containing protein n=1 Tax=Amycolatopsis sp. A133 TaxID=3064472 RepID=UPI0027FDD1CA|nr:transglycosylase domain-containing protein [Amycolatopsis sp. A133]MDQ7804627.1 transglycosylase domain-containing protein [Amycolatopsis sp. A133]
MPNLAFVKRRQGVVLFAGLCVLAGILVAGTVAPAAIGAGLLSNQVSDSVDAISARLAAADLPLTTTVTDRDGTPIATLYAQYRLPVTAAGIATTMKAAIIAIEDRRFYTEGGVDLQGMLRAAVNDSAGGALQGASTITQQDVKNYLINVVDRTDPAAQQADREDSLARKLREAKMAVELNNTMSKDDILANYLNVVEFSGTVYGVGAAAKAYFGTTADKLTVPQAALLAGMVNNPTVYNPYTHPGKALQRRNLVIDDLVTNGSIPASYAATAKAAPLGLLPDGPVTPSGSCLGAAPDAGFFCAYAESYLVHAGFTADRLATGGYTVKTTLDPRVSQVTKDAVDTNVPTTQDGVANTFAVVQPGQDGHQVLAMVANRDYGTDPDRGETSTDIVADTSNEFGAGSSFKIFTSAAALVSGKAGLDTPLPNPDSQCFPGPDAHSSCYTVHNDGHYADPITLADGLATSPNVAFVGLESQVGMPAVLDMADKLGLRNTLATNDAGRTPDPESGNPQYSEPQSQYFRNLLSFTLGNSPVSPLEMANVSATLMSGGVWCPPNPILSVTDRNGNAVPVRQQACERVIPAGVADTLEAGLSKDTTSGTSAQAAHAAGWTRPDIGKTGTTQLSESVAFVGGVDDYAVSSMVFADGPHPREICPGTPVHLGSCGHGAFGGTVAAPPYFHAMSQLLAGVPDRPIPAPDPAYLAARS